MGRVVCRVKLLEKRCSGNSVVPLLWLYFIRLKLNSPAKNVALPSALIFCRSDSRNFLFNLCGFIVVLLIWNCNFNDYLFSLFWKSMFENHFIVIRNVIRQHQLKTFIMLSGFWPLRGWVCVWGGRGGGGGWVNPIKKKICDKNLFYR